MSRCGAFDGSLQPTFSFVGEKLDVPVDDRLHGTLAATAVRLAGPARVPRSSRARTRHVLDIVSVIRGDMSPARVIRGPGLAGGRHAAEVRSGPDRRGAVPVHPAAAPGTDRRQATVPELREGLQ